MIISKTLEIEKQNYSTIETCLLEMGIEPLRWAIIEVGEHTLKLSVSYETGRNNHG